MSRASLLCPTRRNPLASSNIAFAVTTWGSQAVQHLKTMAAYREIDRCPEVAELLRQYIGTWLAVSIRKREHSKDVYRHPPALAPSEAGEAGAL